MFEQVHGGKNSNVLHYSFIKVFKDTGQTPSRQLNTHFCGNLPLNVYILCDPLKDISNVLLMPHKIGMLLVR